MVEKGGVIYLSVLIHQRAAKMICPQYGGFTQLYATYNESIYHKMHLTNMLNITNYKSLLQQTEHLEPCASLMHTLLCWLILNSLFKENSI